MRNNEYNGTTVFDCAAATLAAMNGTFPRQAPNDSPGLKRHQENVRGFGRPARVLAASEEPPLGAHLVTPRRGYAHHGIYVGHGRVVHYKSALLRFWRSPVEEVALDRFALGRPIWVHIHTAPRFNAAEIAHRARSRLGQDRYRLFTNNCEHLCEWCVQDEPHSYQVERLMNLCRWLPRVGGGAASVLMPLGDNGAISPPTNARLIGESMSAG